MSDEITVVIPFKNNIDSIDLAIKSTLYQTHKNTSLILIDDGSNDGSLDVVNKYHGHPNIKIFSDGKSLGLPARLNESVSYVKTKYLARMDADDIQVLDRLEVQLKKLKKYNSDLVCSGFYRFTDNPLQIVDASSYTETKFLTKGDIFNGSSILHPSVLGKTDWFKKNQYNEKFLKGQDQELWMRTVKDTKILRLKDELLFYRVDKNLDFEKINKTLKLLAGLYWQHGLYNRFFKNYVKVVFYTTINKAGIGKLYFKLRTNPKKISTNVIMKFEKLIGFLK